MKLENFLALTRTTLINEPCINGFENIIFDLKKVKRGDLFFAYNVKEVEAAVANGAYGVIFDKPTQITDSEIAWIKSDDLDATLKRLLRFKMIEKEVTVYECNEIILKLSLQVITQTNFFVFHTDNQLLYKSLENMDEKVVVLFCPTLNDREIFTDIKTLPKTAIKPIEIMEQTLFETSFIYDDTFYERQLISPFFIPYLEELLHLFKNLKINFRLRKFTPIEHFEPVFVSKKFEIKNFGTSDKVLIFEKNTSLIDSEMIFLQKHASWANIIFIVPFDVTCSDKVNIYKYKNEQEIIEILKGSGFNFALIVGVDKSILEKSKITSKQLTIDF